MKTFRNYLMNGAIAIVMIPGAAFAQAQAPQSAGAQSDYGIEEIVVTAQRREEGLSRTPVAVQVISADALQQSNARGQEDLRSLAPGLSIRAAQNSNELNFAIRGQSQDPLSDSPPGAVPYFNEVPIGNKSGNGAYFDLSSVQVLKGPQGTLFGRSATGGAILFSTTKPGDEFGGYVAGSLGNYSLRQAEGAVDIPIVGDKVLYRFAAFYRERDGFQKNIFPGPRARKREGDGTRWALRPSLTLKLGETVTNTSVLDYVRTRGGSMTPVITGLLPFTGVGAPFVPAEILYGGSAPGARTAALATISAFLGGVPTSAIEPYYDAYFAAGTGHNPGGLRQELIDQQARGPYVINSDGRSKYKSRSTTFTNVTTIELGDNATLKNIFGYVDISSVNGGNSDGTGFGLGNHFLFNPITGVTVDGGISDRYKEVSEELQLQGTILDDRLNYTTGIYYSDEDRGSVNVQPFFDILFGGSRQVNDYVFKNKTHAVYGQGTYKLNDGGLSVTVGARYTVDKRGKVLRAGDSFRLTNPVAPAGIDYDQSTTYKRLSWQFGIQDQITPELLLYAVTRRAYRAGGYNGTVVPKVGTAAVAGDSYVGEKVTDVELGAKFAGRLGDIPTRLSVSGFNYWIRNAQRLAFTLANGNPSSLTVNVPKGKTYGFEVEAQIAPTPWLKVGGAFNYIHASYSADIVFVNGDPQIFDQVPDTPSKSGNIYADVTIPLSNDLSATLHGDVYGQTKTSVSPRSGNNAGTIIKGYTVANFRAGIQDEKAGWSLTANLKNAFKKKYYVGGLATGEIFQINILVPAEPRTFSIDAKFRF